MRWTTAFAGLAGSYVLYRLFRQTPQAAPASPAAFAEGEATPENFVQVRNAGPEAISTPHDDWDEVDQRSDESFPASDPGAKY